MSENLNTHHRGTEAQRKATQRKTEKNFGFLCVASASLRLCGKGLSIF
jgi:hypothetical protein